MQIHELDTYTGTPSDTDFLAVDDGTETFKVPITSVGVSTEMTLEEAEEGTGTEPRVITPAVLNSYVSKNELLVVEVASFSSLPQTVTNANITAGMVVVNSVLGTPSAQTSDWEVTTSDGSLTISGSISGSTTATLYLMKSHAENGMATSIISKQDGYFVKEGVTVYRQGKLRIVKLTSPSQWCATLGESDRPSIGVGVIGKVYNGSAYVDCLVSVGTNGRVEVKDFYGSYIANAQYNFLNPRWITYFVN